MESMQFKELSLIFLLVIKVSANSDGDAAFDKWNFKHKPFGLAGFSFGENSDLLKKKSDLKVAASVTLETSITRSTVSSTAITTTSGLIETLPIETFHEAFETETEVSGNVKESTSNNKVVFGEISDPKAVQNRFSLRPEANVLKPTKSPILQSVVQTRQTEKYLRQLLPVL